MVIQTDTMTGSVDIMPGFSGLHPTNINCPHPFSVMKIQQKLSIKLTQVLKSNINQLWMRCLTFHDYLNVGKVKAVSAHFFLRHNSLMPRHCLDTAALVIIHSSPVLAACQAGHSVSGFPTLSSKISLSGRHAGDGHNQRISRFT